jgi:DNA mismatch endonuclease (patch repair protein)
MTDNLTPERRSWQMSRVGGKNTGPELRVRRVAHALGLRFRLHGADLPGRPDIVLPRRKAVVFVNGCFWHRHANCRRTTMPATRSDYWMAKFAATEARDARTTQQLQAAGWRVIVIWECETRDAAAVERALSGLFHPT